VAIAVGGTLAGLAIAFSIAPLRTAILDALGGDTGAVREDLNGLGVAGPFLVFGLAIVHTVLWYPAEILDAAAGYLFGFGWGLPLVWSGWMVSAMLAYWLGLHAARPLLYELIGERRFERVEHLIERGGVTFLLAARLVPIVPFSLLGLTAGAARVPFGRFLWTTAVGYLPITVYFTYLGSKLEGFSAEDPLIWIGAAGFLLAFLGLRHLVPSRASQG
jgi:uncharacterized membrane protein YdjX (TVP38/TMEM64 family)